MIPTLLRREPPNGYLVYLLTLDGETPLLMSSGEADRESPLYREYRAVSKTRAKTLEQEAKLRELEWHTRIYFDEELGPYVPGKNVKEMLRSAATKWKLGEAVKRSLVIPDYRIPLTYEGPRDLSGLWEQGFRYTTMVANAGAGAGRVERTRPCFDSWSLTCEIAFDTDELDPDQVASLVKRSEKYGLGDYRPEFGAFTTSLEFVREQKAHIEANGAKPRDKRAELAKKKHHERVTA
ncbi:MAG: hypothetical protein WD377_02635 [Nitriliruptoraceae bacterium]